jgi:hypothetical protein
MSCGVGGVVTTATYGTSAALGCAALGIGPLSAFGHVHPRHTAAVEACQRMLKATHAGKSTVAN